MQRWKSLETVLRTLVGQQTNLEPEAVATWMSRDLESKAAALVLAPIELMLPLFRAQLAINLLALMRREIEMLKDGPPVEEWLRIAVLETAIDYLREAMAMIVKGGNSVEIEGKLMMVQSVATEIVRALAERVRFEGAKEEGKPD